MKVVDANKLRKEYGNLVAVNDVELQIEKGQVLGLIGPNGAGKTTLLKMLATLLRPTGGRLQVLGHDAVLQYQEVRRGLGYMPDFFDLYDDLTLEECVRFFGRSYGVVEEKLAARVDEALDFVGLSDKRLESVQHLSRGMTQRLGIANLLVHDPEFILLDEPASGLDPAARIQLRNILKGLAARGKTIVISSHILTDLEELCTHVLAMDNGKVVAQGSLESIRLALSSSITRVSIVGEVDHAAEIARSLPEVKSVTTDGGDILLAIEVDPEARAAVNAGLVKKGVMVSGLQEEKQGLEALFLKMTEQEADEEASS